MTATSLGLLALGLTAARADGPMPQYQGIHPLSPHQGAFCYIDVPHVHRLPPPDLRVYLMLKDRTNVFIGDPVALGYDGLKFGYFGPHPLPITGVPELAQNFCYINGPHYHAVPPAPSPALITQAGVTWYLGPLPPPPDPGRVWINEVHAIVGYAPPKVDLSMAPPGYHAFTPPAPAKPATPPPSPKAAPSPRPAPGTRPAAPARPAKSATAPAPGGQP